MSSIETKPKPKPATSISINRDRYAQAFAQKLGASDFTDLCLPKKLWRVVIDEAKVGTNCTNALTVRTAEPDDTRGRWVADLGGCPVGAKETAIARLIAAAPTMYLYLCERAAYGDRGAAAIVEGIFASGIDAAR
jgi:hypothetical protein